MALASYMEEPKIKALSVGKPFVTIFMTNEEKRSYHEMKKKQNIPNQLQQPQLRPNFLPFPGIPDQMMMNPQLRMPMMNPGMNMPNQNIPLPNQNFSSNIQPNLIPNMQMQGGQFPQSQMGGRGYNKLIQPRNN